MVKGADGQMYYYVDKGDFKAWYDRAGHLQRIEHDKNKDGRMDHVAHHRAGKTPRFIEIDQDFDGRMDRWEDYDEAGTLVKIGVARRGGGPDMWTVPGPDGQPLRQEYDQSGDGKPDRIEVMEGGRIARIETDADGDGRMDGWQAWQQGRMTQEELDTDGDGRPDRRIRNGKRGEVLGMEAVGR
jgi:hypothetical protein